MTWREFSRKINLTYLACNKSSSSILRRSLETYEAQFYSVFNPCIPSVCRTEGALRVWMRLLPAYNPLDVCQHNDRYKMVLIMVLCKEVVPWKLSGARSAFLYTHPTRETVTTKPAPQDQTHHTPEGMTPMSPTSYSASQHKLTRHLASCGQGDLTFFLNFKYIFCCNKTANINVKNCSLYSINRTSIVVQVQNVNGE